MGLDTKAISAIGNEIKTENAAKDFVFTMDECIAEVKSRGLTDDEAKTVCTDMKKKYESGELRLG